MEADEPVTVWTVNNPYQAGIMKAALAGPRDLLPIGWRGPSRALDILEIGILVRAKDADLARKIIRHNETKHQTRRRDGLLTTTIPKSQLWRPKETVRSPLLSGGV